MTTEREIVTLCGSLRFAEAYRRANLEETLAGRIVLLPGCPDKRYCHSHSEIDGSTLNAVHHAKIAMSEKVIVVSDESGYVGDATRDEIAYAESLGKPIEYRRYPRAAAPDPPPSGADLDDLARTLSDSIADSRKEAALYRENGHEGRALRHDREAEEFERQAAALASLRSRVRGSDGSARSRSAAASGLRRLEGVVDGWRRLAADKRCSRARADALRLCSAQLQESLRAFADVEAESAEDAADSPDTAAIREALYGPPGRSEEWRSAVDAILRYATTRAASGTQTLDALWWIAQSLQEAHRRFGEDGAGLPSKNGLAHADSAG